LKPLACAFNLIALAEAIEDNIHTGAGERFRDAEPDPACRTRYNGCLALRCMLARSIAILSRMHRHYLFVNRVHCTTKDRTASAKTEMPLASDFNSLRLLSWN
jgi:hypothetical protein